MRETPNVERTLSYHQTGFLKSSLLVALAALAFGSLGVLTRAHRPASYAVAWVLLVFGAVWGGYALFRLFTPGQPVLVLSPRGVFYRIPGIKKIFVPWSEVLAVESRDLVVSTGGFGPLRRTKAENITVLLVSRRFYDAFLHVDSGLLRGFWWSNTFSVRGDKVQMALPHMLMGVKSEELRRAVEERWRAFSEAGRSALAPPPRYPTAPDRRRDFLLLLVVIGGLAAASLIFLVSRD